MQSAAATPRTGDYEVAFGNEMAQRQVHARRGRPRDVHLVRSYVRHLQWRGASVRKRALKRCCSHPRRVQRTLPRWAGHLRARTVSGLYAVMPLATKEAFVAGMQTKMSQLQEIHKVSKNHVFQGRSCAELPSWCVRSTRTQTFSGTPRMDGKKASLDRRHW